MDGGDTAVHEARRRAWAEASYWLSATSVAVAAPSNSGDPDEEDAEAGWARGAEWAEEPRKNWAPSPPGMPAAWAPWATLPLLTDHRLGYWLKRKGGGTSGSETWGGAPGGGKESPANPTPDGGGINGSFLCD